MMKKQQITLTFDMPLSEPVTNEVPKDTVVHDLDEDVKEMPVKDYIELITVTETNEKGETRYALDDYLEFESAINQTDKKPLSDVIDEVEDQEVVFEKKMLESQTTEESVEEIDPMNSPISDLLKERAEERRRKMKDFNYKFNNAKIDDIEKIPAYKRQGIDLDDVRHSSEDTSISGTSISTDDNDDMQLRSNNSFLHDNVD